MGDLQDPIDWRYCNMYHMFGHILGEDHLKNRPYIWNRYLQSIGSWNSERCGGPHGSHCIFADLHIVTIYIYMLFYPSVNLGVLCLMILVIHDTSWYIWHPKIGLFQTVKLSDLEKIICQDVTSAWHLWFQGCERQQADWWRTCGNKWYQQPETADFSRENMLLTTKHVLGRKHYESKPWYSGENQTIPPTIWYCTGFDPCRNSTLPYCPKMKYVQNGCDCSDQDANNQKRGVNSSKCDLTIQTILMIRLTHKTDMRIETSIQVWFCP